MSGSAISKPNDALRIAARERDDLVRIVSTRWPAAARDVLLIAARVDCFNRSALGLGLAPLAADPLCGAAAAMWRGLIDVE